MNMSESEILMYMEVDYDYNSSCLLGILALSDLILAVSLPLWAYSSQNLVSCQLVTGVYQLGFYSGTLFVTLMSMDRYLAIVHAVAAMRARTLRYGITAAFIIWVISVIMAIPQVIFASLEIDEEDNSSQCQPLYPEDRQLFWKLRRNFSENIVGLFVCLPIMIFCYVKILIVLSKSRNSKKDKAVKLIFTIVCVFLVCRLWEKFRKSLGKVRTKYFCWGYQSTGMFSHRDTTDKETSNTLVRSDY
uniref:Si:cabz01093077.1 n=1 Tax=Mastacembelus armatus TaxID=205130 RepID=A0A3Q3NNL4_9TELE